MRPWSTLKGPEQRTSLTISTEVQPFYSFVVHVPVGKPWLSVAYWSLKDK